MASDPGRIEALFHKARGLSPEEWPAFLSQACAGKQSLADEVLALLQAYDETPDFLDSVPGFFKLGSTADCSDGNLVGEVRRRKVVTDREGRLTDLTEHALPAGQVIGGFRIIGQIGKGGMAAVYEAEQLSIGRRVALKVLPPFLNFSEEAVKRFRREAKISGRRQHPAIISIIAVGQHGGTHYLAMELAGKSLHDELSALRSEPGSVQRFATGSTAHESYLQCMVSMFARLAEALASLHHDGILHRDIKPSNLLFSKDGSRLMLADFGLARDEQTSRMTRTGQQVGTVRYMSPEQLFGRPSDVDQRSDIWSLGVALFEAVTLALPYQAKSEIAHVAAVESRDPLPARQIARAVPRDLETVLLKCLAREPNRRYASAQELAEDLVRFGEHRSVEARRPPPWYRFRRYIRHRWAAVLVTALSIIVFGLAIIALGRNWWAGGVTTPSSVPVAGPGSELDPDETGNLGSNMAQERTPAVAARVVKAGSTIRGEATDGSILWVKQFDDQVWEAGDFDLTPSDGANRFYVISGGWNWGYEQKSAGRIPPQLTIFSGNGDQRADIPLLEHFNPFGDAFPERRYRAEVQLIADLDLDDYEDLIVSFNHIYYPSILYFISGKTRQCVAALANSGHIVSVVAGRNNGSSVQPRPVAVLTINNKMAEQYAITVITDFGWTVSPDLQCNEEIRTNYRPVLRPTSRADILRADESGLFVYQRGETPRRFDFDCIFDDEPGFDDASARSRMELNLESMYRLVHLARDAIRAGEWVEAERRYREAEGRAFDEPQRRYVWFEAAGALKDAGKYDSALSWLPESPEESADSYRIFMMKGELLTLVGKYQEAKDTYLKTINNHYCCAGFVRAAVLGGASANELQIAMSTYYPAYLNYPATRAWLNIPAMLHGTADESFSSDLGQHESYPTGVVDDDASCFPLEEQIWAAFAALESGRPAPRLSWETIDARYDNHALASIISALEAVRIHSRSGDQDSLSALGQSCHQLREVALTSSVAIIPYILIAYRYGFAADEAGKLDIFARQALEEAIERYPDGGKAEWARRILGRNPAGGSD